MGFRRSIQPIFNLNSSRILWIEHHLHCINWKYWYLIDFLAVSSIENDSMPRDCYGIYGSKMSINKLPAIIQILRNSKETHQMKYIFPSFHFIKIQYSLVFDWFLLIRQPILLLWIVVLRRKFHLEIFCQISTRRKPVNINECKKNRTEQNKKWEEKTSEKRENK